MSDEKPNLLDKTLTEAWSKKKCLEELHRHATAGHAEWSMLLLERTKYETLPKFLDPESWKGENTDSLQRLTTVVEYVLSEAPEHLPTGLDPDRVVANFKQAILKSRGPAPKVN
jgi:hypothetical protein